MKSKEYLLVAVSLLIVSLLLFPTQVSAQGVELGDSAVLTAEVVAIDRVDRVLALLGSDGEVIEIEVGHEARNFGQIEIGDTVRIEYYESVALYLGRHGEKPDAAAGLVAGRSAKGDKPAGFAVETIDVSAKVRTLDKKSRLVTLELPGGKLVLVNVDKSITAFDSLKPGDSIHARYTKSFAISVEKP